MASEHVLLVPGTSGVGAADVVAGASASGALACACRRCALDGKGPAGLSGDVGVDELGHPLDALGGLGVVVLAWTLDACLRGASSNDRDLHRGGVERATGNAFCGAIQATRDASGRVLSCARALFQRAALCLALGDAAELWMEDLARTPDAGGSKRSSAPGAVCQANNSSAVAEANRLVCR